MTVERAKAELIDEALHLAEAALHQVWGEVEEGSEHVADVALRSIRAAIDARTEEAPCHATSPGGTKE